MLRFLLRRLLVALLVALAVSSISFSLAYLSGDPAIAIAGAGGSAKDAALIRELYGFDRPIVVQYADWIVQALQGNLGTSYYFSMPVSQIIAERIPVTLLLGTASFIVAMLLALPLGIIAALKPNGLLDRIALLIAVSGQAIPSFWLGLILIVVFGVWLDLVPISGADSWTGFILPVVVLSYYALPALMRLMRASMIDVLQANYIRTARSKGLGTTTVILGHALRNAVLPLVSVAAVQLGILLSGSIVIESVFALNGLGRLAWESLLRSDLAVVQGIILILSLVYVLLTTLADLINAWLDPRIREA
ncbi:ABC transporter permease [Oceanisphaera psychrotolerans]|uniref:ABC transporter permease n=1 Tax=Oceanisphaera psychrotolerans TaxID=1414654 RepID=A0A1J4QEL7_9GAMM|nr:ABC transporter permease [Oceanisphaera psychrotolerans]OIN12219.1 ABC transporter permease [Oceanisphaera psychrotolerans]